jgi:hypothetical protein
MEMRELESELCDTNLSNPYFMFKFSIRSEITRKYYERRIKKFFDCIEFSPDLGMEERCNKFAEQASNNLNWVLDRIVYFLQFGKEHKKVRLQQETGSKNRIKYDSQTTRADICIVNHVIFYLTRTYQYG